MNLSDQNLKNIEKDYTGNTGVNWLQLFKRRYISISWHNLSDDNYDPSEFFCGLLFGWKFSKDALKTLKLTPKNSWFGRVVYSTNEDTHCIDYNPWTIFEKNKKKKENCYSWGRVPKVVLDTEIVLHGTQFVLEGEIFKNDYGYFTCTELIQIIGKCDRRKRNNSYYKSEILLDPSFRCLSWTKETWRVSFEDL